MYRTLLWIAFSVAASVMIADETSTCAACVPDTTLTEKFRADQKALAAELPAPAGDKLAESR